MEAFTLSISRKIAREVSDDIRRMLGYSIHPPFVGAVTRWGEAAGRSPRRVHAIEDQDAVPASRRETP